MLLLFLMILLVREKYVVDFLMLLLTLLLFMLRFIMKEWLNHSLTVLVMSGLT